MAASAVYSLVSESSRYLSGRLFFRADNKLNLLSICQHAGASSAGSQKHLERLQLSSAPLVFYIFTVW